ncbi:oxygenase [Leptospira kobayashii]|uniref:Oxygenase n=1 Tax=Leptospira kobayashii TaxID=1917830 RepID=A0ABM7UHS5_9LEPT|nr:FAD-dependent monooxygenase [Leptospira kobayashii]BDA78248.1 oxygenase [Leptospira kobayashii]
MKLSETEVLISGAGPTGLFAACQLAQWGIQFRIIEKGSAFSNFSRALAIQARTLEIFEQIGIAEKVISQGERIKGILLLFKNKMAIGDLGDLGEDITPYPFLLVLPQDKTEKILAEHLEKQGGKVEWQTQLISLQEKPDSISGIISGPNGEEKIQAQYIIGADGAHSTVRHSLGIEFIGDSYEHNFYLGDLEVHWELPRGYAVLSPAEEGLNGFFPMPGELRYRVLGIIPESEEGKKVDLGLVQKILDERVPVQVRVSDPHWLSQYKLHHRFAKSFRQGRAFLCGDAGHIHSPAGGQGMNTGLQDAHNLAWKLASVLRKKTSSHILNSYEEERLPFAKQLVTETDRLFTLMTGQKRISKLIRRFILPFLVPVLFSFPMIRRKIFKRISQTQISYKNSLLSEAVSSKLSGIRLPHAKLSTGESVLNKIDNSNFHLILLENVKLDHLDSVWPGLKIHTLTPGSEPNFAKAVRMKKGMILVRPDQYIAFQSEKISIPGLKRYFAKINV